MVVALAGQHAMRSSAATLAPLEVIGQIQARVADPEFRERINRVGLHLSRQSAAAEVAADFKLQSGVSGYVLHTVPIALFCWLRWSSDFARRSNKQFCSVVTPTASAQSWAHLQEQPMEHNPFRASGKIA